MQDVSTGEDTFKRGLPVLENFRTAGAGIQTDPCGFRQLILRKQTDGQQQGITLEIDLRAGNRIQFLIHL